MLFQCITELPVFQSHCEAVFTSAFGRPFVKRFTVCYRTVVLSCLSVMLVHCGQTVGWIKMKLGTEVGLGSSHIVLDGDPARPPPQKKGAQPPVFSAHVRCGQMAGQTKVPLGMEVGISSGDFVLDGDPAPPTKNGGTTPNYRPMSIVAKRLDGSRCH